MAKTAKSRLQAAIANEKGVDFKKLAQKKRHREALRRNRRAGKGGVEEKKSQEAEAEEDDDDWEGVDEEEENTKGNSAVSAFIDGSADEVEDEDADTDEDELDEGVSIQTTHRKFPYFQLLTTVLGQHICHGW